VVADLNVEAQQHKGVFSFINQEFIVIVHLWIEKYMLL